MDCFFLNVLDCDFGTLVEMYIVVLQWGDRVYSCVLDWGI
jgi:hypothetical protein